MNRARRVISWCGFAEQLSSHLPFLLGHLPEVQRCQRFQVMDGEQPVIGPFGHWIADQHKSFQVLAGPQVVDLREVLNPIGHEQQVLQRWQVLAESVNILDPVAIGDDGAQPIKIGEVVEGLQLILAEIDALIVVLHQGRSTSVAAVLLMADKPLPRKVSSRQPNWFTKLGDLLINSTERVIKQYNDGILLKSKIYRLVLSLQQSPLRKLQNVQRRANGGRWGDDWVGNKYELCLDEYGAVLTKDTYHRSSFSCLRRMPWSYAFSCLNLATLWASLSYPLALSAYISAIISVAVLSLKYYLLYRCIFSLNFSYSSQSHYNSSSGSDCADRQKAKRSDSSSSSTLASLSNCGGILRFISLQAMYISWSILRSLLLKSCSSSFGVKSRLECSFQNCCLLHFLLT